jgi:hypothetical protein
MDSDHKLTFEFVKSKHDPYFENLAKFSTEKSWSDEHIYQAIYWLKHSPNSPWKDHHRSLRLALGRGKMLDKRVFDDVRGQFVFNLLRYSVTDRLKKVIAGEVLPCKDNGIKLVENPKVLPVPTPFICQFQLGYKGPKLSFTTINHLPTQSDPQGLGKLTNPFKQR